MVTPNPISTAAIILAAGKGTRMKSEKPKVMHEIGHAPMLNHVIQTARAAGLSPIIVVVSEDMPSVSAFAKEQGAHVVVQKEQLGTAHAVLSAEKTLSDFKGNVVVLYGDTPLIKPETLSNMLQCVSKDAQTAAAVLGFTPEDPAAYGRLVLNSENLLERIVEARDASEEQRAIRLCNSGVMALRGTHVWEILNSIDNNNAKEEYYLTDAIEIARSKGFRSRVVQAETEEVIGVNSRSELAQAETIFQNRVRQKMMDKGVTLQDPASVYFAFDTSVGEDTVIEPHVYFGQGVAVGSHSHIKAYSHIEGTVIGQSCTIGPFARLRPGTNIAENVKIGNFVEIKKSEIEARAKISHLSYIGDASVGEAANIGAGTITCNYDGYNKYHTQIGAEAFIGSNTALVAPIKIGDGAMIAAGSVITEDIAADALALARPRQEQKDTWAREFRNKQNKQEAS